LHGSKLEKAWHTLGSVLVCDKCGKENPDEARFCLACGTPFAVAAAVGAREVRKTVTVVFSDVIGSTALGERLDPESLRRVMGRYFEEMRAVLARHGGTVEKFIGDAVVAVFGIPLLHEDDALRAVRAASEMRNALAGLNDELERERGLRISARIGVNTGEVVAGDPASGEAFATGDAVNVAARLEQAAQPGEILIGDKTLDLVRDAVRVERVEPLALKGKAETVAAFRLLEVVPGVLGRARRLDSPMVGREHERKLLADALERTVRERTCHLFTVLGSAGVGKSRLVEESLLSLGERALVLRGRCLPYGTGITFWPVVEAVKQATALTDEQEPGEAEARLAVLVAGDENAGVIVERIAELMGIAETTSSGEETFWGVRRLFETLARKRPLVVVFDDIHWGEPTFLDLIEHVADWSRDAPILLICLARPELLDARTAWGGGKLNATAVFLQPLTGAESERLIDNLLGRAELEQSARERVAQAAEGNPLFVEEMLAMLIDEGLLERRNGGWTPTGDLSQIAVPPTIHALLAARLDRLEQEQRGVIERASVEGKVFHGEAVAELSPDALRSGVGAHLMALLRKELIRPDRSAFAGDEAFRFRHMLLRDAAYQGIPKQLRAELHEQFADWLERKAGERVGEHEEILGYHLEQAYRYRIELGPPDERARALAERAAERLAAAGHRALGRGDAGAGANLVSRAVSLLARNDPDRLALLPELGQALVDTGELAQAESVLDEAMDAGDPLVAARALLMQLYLELSTNPEATLDDIVREVERAIPMFERMGDDRGLANAWRLLAWVYLMRCHASAMQDALERAATYARRAHDRRLELESMGWLTYGALLGPMRPADGIRYCEAIVERAGGERRVEGYALMPQALLRAELGAFDEARDLFARGRQIVEDLGLTVEVGGGQYAAGLLEMLAGDPAAAERELSRGYALLEGVGETAYRSTLSAGLAHALYAQGRYSEAEKWSQVSEREASRDDVASQLSWRTARAKVLAERGQFDAAERLVREGLALVAESDFLDMRGDALLDLATVLRLAGRSDEAADAAERALQLYELKGNVVSAAKARAFTAELVV
jgi:class 3 adenylate cyclase/tetratricopeptide (TPR) repeat protein